MNKLSVEKMELIYRAVQYWFDKQWKVSIKDVANLFKISHDLLGKYISLEIDREVKIYRALNEKEKDLKKEDYFLIHYYLKFPDRADPKQCYFIE